MWVPRSIRGGAELDPVSSLEVIENLSYGDPSAGWVLMASALAIGTGARVPRRRGGRRTVRRRASAGHRRAGHAAGNGGAGRRRLPAQRLVELRLRHQARHPHPHARRHRRHRRTADLRPAGRAGDAHRQLGRARAARHRQHRLHDRLGVRAGGVHAFRGHRDAEARRRALHDRRHRLRDHVPLGMGLRHRPAAARRARRRRARRRPAAPARSAASDSFQEQYAKAEATYRSARAFVYEAWSDVQATLDRGEPLSVRQHTLIRLAMANVTWSAHEVAAFVYKSARHDGAARRHDPAAVSRHARRHAARHLGAAGVPGRRPRAGRPRDREEVGVSEPRGAR